jgi:hypothetical protein
MKLTAEVLRCPAQDFRDSLDNQHEQEKRGATSASAGKQVELKPKLCARIRVKGCTDPAQPNTEVIVLPRPARNPGVSHRANRR